MNICETCKFFELNSQPFQNAEGSFPATGWCRRHAPLPKTMLLEEHNNLLQPLIAEWPFVDGDNWCGEYSPND
jgi:hypothetical protein